MPQKSQLRNSSIAIRDSCSWVRDGTCREKSYTDTASGRKNRVDFFRQNYGSAFWDIIELKTPTDSAVVRPDGLHPRLSSLVYDAINQAEDYRNLIDSDGDLRQRLQSRGIQVYRPEILIVVGRSDASIDPLRMRELYDRVNRGPIEFRTYDDIHRFAIEHYRDTKLVVLPANFLVKDTAIIPTITGTNLLASVAVSQVHIEALAAMIGSTRREFTLETWRGMSNIVLDLSDIDTDRASKTYDKQVLAELAGYALAFWTAHRELQLVPTERSRRGDAIDYWVAPINPAVDTLQLWDRSRLALLEVSLSNWGRGGIEAPGTGCRAAGASG